MLKKCRNCNQTFSSPKQFRDHQRNGKKSQCSKSIIKFDTAFFPEDLLEYNKDENYVTLCKNYVKIEPQLRHR